MPLTAGSVGCHGGLLVAAGRGRRRDRGGELHRRRAAAPHPSDEIEAAKVVTIPWYRGWGMRRRATAGCTTSGAAARSSWSCPTGARSRSAATSPTPCSPRSSGPARRAPRPHRRGGLNAGAGGRRRDAAPAGAPPALDRPRRRAAGARRRHGLDTSGGLLFNHSLWARDRVVTAFDLIDVEPRAGLRDRAGARGPAGRAPPRAVRGGARPHPQRAPRHARLAGAAVAQGAVRPRASRRSGAARRPATRPTSPPTRRRCSSCSWRRSRGASRASSTTPVARSDGRPTTLRDSVVAACGWIEGHLSGDGLVEAGQSNPLALQQVWKDGPTSNFDERGRMAERRAADGLSRRPGAGGRGARPGGRPAGRPPGRACAPRRAPSATPPSPTSGCPSGATSATPSTATRTAAPRLLRVGAVQRRLDARHELLRRPARDAARGAGRRHRAHALLGRAAHAGRHSRPRRCPTTTRAFATTTRTSGRSTPRRSPAGCAARAWTSSPSSSKRAC